MKTVSAIYLHHIYDACLEHGALSHELLNFIPGGKKALMKTKARFSTQCVFDILSHSEKQTKKPEIGLLTGQSLRPSSLGDLGHAIMACHSLRQVILINRRYQPLTQQVGRSNLKIMEGKAWLSWECGLSDPEYYRNITDTVMANHVQFARWLSWVHNKEVHGVYFRHARPAYADLYTKIFECPIHFGQAQDAMVFDVEAIDLPLPQPNPKMLREVCLRLDTALLDLKEPSTCRERLAKFISSNLMFGTPTIKQAAQNFGMSERSLRRSLSEEGTSFRSVLEKIRQELCENLMAEGDLSLADIAERLGYSEQSAFNRAFKSWHEQSPKAYLRAQKYFNEAFAQLAP